MRLRGLFHCSHNNQMVGVGNIRHIMVGGARSPNVKTSTVLLKCVFVCVVEGQCEDQVKVRTILFPLIFAEM